MPEPTKEDLDNHANQLNPNNPEYSHSRNQGDDSPSDAEFERMPNDD